MSRKIQQRKSNKKKIADPNWKIVGRVTGDRVELVQVPIDKASDNEDVVIQVLKGRSLEGFNRKSNKSSVGPSEKRTRPSKRLKKKAARPRVSRPQQGMLSDHTGSIALQAFQAAVREAKRR